MKLELPLNGEHFADILEPLSEGTRPAVPFSPSQDLARLFAIQYIPMLCHAKQFHFN
jgi:hypothetical protein